MRVYTSHWKMLFASVITLILLSYSPSAASSSAITGSPSRCFYSIISFGDSLADTGNYIRLCSADKPPRSARPPYGRNFFHYPTGRYSDGRIVLDFIAESLGLPSVPPYIGGEKEGRSFSEGVNFAVAGATALDYEFFEKRGIHNKETNVSLRTQLDWFKQFLAAIPDGRKYVEKSLIVMGEIGGNDYNHALMQGDVKSELIKSFVPLVVRCMGAAIEELIELGARTLLVPGNLPIGCLPIYLTQFYTISAANDYEPKTGCLDSLNQLAKNHNEQLKKELKRIQDLHPHVSIIYADYYNIAIRFYLSSKEFGFSNDILRACCGSGEPYNYNETTFCGTPSSTCCDDPSLFVSWDGLHLTEAACRQIALALLQGPFTIPHLTSVCPSRIHATATF